MSTPAMTDRVLISELSNIVMEGRTIQLDEFCRLYFGDDLGVIGPDWAGRPSVPTRVAAEIVNGHRAAKAEDARRREAFAEYLGERNRSREEAASRAFEVEARVRKLEPVADLRPFGVPVAAEAASSTLHGRPIANDPQAFAKREAQREALEHACAAAQEARERFDSKNPELDFETWVKRHDNRKAA